MTSVELKEYIQTHGEIEHILEDLGCRQIVFHPQKDYFTATQPDENADNKMGVVIKNNLYLNYYSYSRGIDVDEKQDIFNLIQTAKGIKFIDAVKYVHKLLGLEFKYSPKKKEPEKLKFDPLAVFKKATSKRRVCNVGDIKFLEEDILDDFYPGIHISWFKEGIMPWTAKKFGLCYSYKQNRQIIPIRYWLDGRLVATNARTTVENYDLFDIKKYYISKGYNKSANLYGFWENHNDIEKAKYCVLFEAEKSVLKRDSLNDPTGLALQGHSLSEEQIRIILSLNINEIIIAMDKDIPIEEVRSICEKFYRIRHVSYIYDRWDILDIKDSPADCGNKIYNFLFKHRIVYDEKEHQKYLKSLEKNNEKRK
jgi:DNA primase